MQIHSISEHHWTKEHKKKKNKKNGLFDKDWIYKQDYIKYGTTEGPINGEQYFVEDSVNERLELIWAPQEWMGVMTKQGEKWLAHINSLYPGEWYYLGEEYNPDIKLVHFQGPLNRPF